MIDAPHLLPAAAAKLSLPDEERIRDLYDEVWIGYPLAQRTLAHLGQLMGRPRRDRMQHLLLIGPTNNGKTSIVRQFQKRNPPDPNLAGDAAKVPVVFVLAPPTPDEAALHDAILANFVTPINPRDGARAKRHQATAILRGAETRMLIIDEIQHLLAGDGYRQRTMVNVIKNLGTEMQMTIVATGVASALNAIRLDEQVSNRFQEWALPRWRLNDEFRRLLASFERTVPLRARSGLASEKLSSKIHALSQGLIGEVAALLAKAAEGAIRGGGEKICEGTLESVDWIPPSERRKATDHAIT